MLRADQHAREIPVKELHSQTGLIVWQVLIEADRGGSRPTRRLVSERTNFVHGAFCAALMTAEPVGKKYRTPDVAEAGKGSGLKPMSRVKNNAAIARTL